MNEKSCTFAQNKKTMDQIITIKDRQFEKFIGFEQIESAIKKVAQDINKELNDKEPLFLAVLNGSFMFVGELMKEITIPCEITFVRFASYSGISSTNNVKELLGLNEEIKGRTVVILEDIVDSGNTIVELIKVLNQHSPKEIKVATLLFKPQALKKEVNLDFVAMEIPNDFIVGFGLDYDGLGRNLKNIYKVLD